jgi:hypothetical protein
MGQRCTYAVTRVGYNKGGKSGREEGKDAAWCVTRVKERSREGSGEQCGVCTGRLEATLIGMYGETRGAGNKQE